MRPGHHRIQHCSERPAARCQVVLHPNWRIRDDAALYQPFRLQLFEAFGEHAVTQTRNRCRDVAEPNSAHPHHLEDRAGPPSADEFNCAVIVGTQGSVVRRCSHVNMLHGADRRVQRIWPAPSVENPTCLTATPWDQAGDGVSRRGGSAQSSQWSMESDVAPTPGWLLAERALDARSCGEAGFLGEVLRESIAPQAVPTTTRASAGPANPSGRSYAASASSISAQAASRSASLSMPNRRMSGGCDSRRFWSASVSEAKR